ncbi:hypothetical protein Tco_0803376 [Tanacetum coccineum]|uniref:Uncharacterized protein n=1 Tax=Tanacetum coccineum TaxID=301880 RepID=A0ABQ5A5T3_9ASTR
MPWHGLTKGAIIQIFYHGLDERTQGILDVTAGGIFLYKSPNQAFQFLEDKVLFEHDWPIKSKNEHHRKSVSFADGSDSNTDNSRFMENLKAMDSQIISLNEELQDIRNKYNELREGNASKNHLNDDTPMCERHEANYIQSEGNKDQNSHDSHSHQSHHDLNDLEKSLTELNNDVRNDLEDFKRRIHGMRTVHWKLFAINDGKTTSVLPNKESKRVNQEPQSKTDLEKSMNKLFDGQRDTKDVEPKQRILNPDDQPMWESAKTVAPTPNSAIIQLDVDDNFVINNTHLNMIRENKFDDEPTKGILDITAGGIFLYKIPNQAFRFLKDKVIFKHDWPIKFKNKHHRKSVSFADGSDSNTNNSRFMEKLKAMDSQIISLNEELQDIRNKYNELRNGNASKNHMNDDTPICECHEANYIQSEDYQNLDSHNSFSRQSHYDPNDSEKSLTVLNNDVRNDLKDFKRRIRSMRIVHWKLHNNNDGKTVITIHP